MLGQIYWNYILPDMHKNLDVHSSVAIMCRNDELSSTISWVGCLVKIQSSLSYLQKIAKSFSKFLLIPFF